MNCKNGKKLKLKILKIIKIWAIKNKKMLKKLLYLKKLNYCKKLKEWNRMYIKKTVLKKYIHF